MLIVTPRHISSFSRCPSRTWKTWNDISRPNPSQALTENIIKASYLHFAKKEKPAGWRMILSWSQADYINNISNVTADNYQDMKGILSRLSTWFDKCYLGDSCEPGITNVPVALALGSDCYFKDQIPILGSRWKIRIYDFYHTNDGPTYRDYTGAKLYNDLTIHARTWALEQAADLTVEEYVRFVVGKEAIKSVRIAIDNNLRSKNNRNIKHIIQGIKDQISYPSFSEQCANCSYRERCSY